MRKIKTIFLVLLFAVVEIQASQKILHLLPGQKQDGSRAKTGLFLYLFPEYTYNNKSKSILDSIKNKYKALNYDIEIYNTAYDQNGIQQTQPVYDSGMRQ